MTTQKAKTLKLDSKDDHKKRAELIENSKAKYLTPELLSELKDISKGVDSRDQKVRLSATNRLHTIADSKGWSLLEAYGTLEEVKDRGLV